MISAMVSASFNGGYVANPRLPPPRGHVAHGVAGANPNGSAVERVDRHG